MNTAPVVVLTPAQRKVVGELARDGADNATIGARLGIAERSVANHLYRAMAATGYPTRTALAVALLRGRLRIRTLDGRTARN